MSDEADNGTNRVSETIGVITQHIRVNALGPGDRLPSENNLSRELNVSRSVVREAFRSLAAMRLINLSPGKRATVAQLDHGAMSLMMEHGVLTEQISIQQIYDVRRTIETRTVTLASLRRTDAEAQRIRQHALAMKEHLDDPDSVMESDLAFHMAIAQASRNPVFAMIVGAFQGVARQSWPIGWRSRTEPEQRMQVVQTHIDIADAVAIGDPQTAATLMKRHFDDSTKVLLDAGLT
ncbi:GntR family transcriptional regulator [Roseobacter cerasinus]|uniref:GntR family transcriptional regulator n=1 Tax=Roseobacter cerasinus TaxID=2602289 RepID=A0A640VNE0_9RHOB|nr:FadR/GntR family transcriptional regulator [Roseobacter cerasinus]GFE48375.1 GntR family transcriptional regulator [Roseobacter cerasinus]